MWIYIKMWIFTSQPLLEHLSEPTLINLSSCCYLLQVLPIIWISIFKSLHLFFQFPYIYFFYSMGFSERTFFCKVFTMWVLSSTSVISSPLASFNVFILSNQQALLHWKSIFFFFCSQDFTAGLIFSILPKDFLSSQEVFKNTGKMGFLYAAYINILSL